MNYYIDSETILIICILCFVAILVIYEKIKSKFDELKRKNSSLQRENEENTKAYERRIKQLKSDYLKTASNLKIFPYMAGVVADYKTYSIKKDETSLNWGYNEARREKARSIRKIREEANELITQNTVSYYQLAYLLKLFPVLSKILETDFVYLSKKNDIFLANEILTDYTHINKKVEQFINSEKSNLTSFPAMANIVADIETYYFEVFAKILDWGTSQERAKKIKSIRELRAEAQSKIEKYKEAEYQLSYLLELYPILEEVIETDFKELPNTSSGDISELGDKDRVKDFVSKEEWEKLSRAERNQLALERYVSSHTKTKWQIGRDYELFVGYMYGKKGFSVDYFGSYMGMDDLGRDLICKKGQKTLLIQCKYWSQCKTIHENHICQLYGTKISYCIENDLQIDSVSAILATNISLSETAKKFADYLKIKVVENLEMGEFPRIKCNIGHDIDGNESKIYHLPFDQQYDSTKIDKDGEFFALTVEEAEKAGFRRAFKWYSTKNNG